MRESKLSIHSENILPIIKKWLYSDKDIFIRELVSNACDAMSKLKIIQGEPALEGAKIQITLDKKAKTLTISDAGVGMTEEEVEKYIAQIAFSGAEEFLSQYQNEKDSDPMIGHFGLGFYSAYMVAEKVEIQTLSYLPESRPVFWSCDGGSQYTVGEGCRSQKGTDIILYLSEENLEYLEESKIQSLLQRFCSFMPFPIEYNGNALGNQEPLWLKNPSDCSETDYLGFYRSLFPLEPDPMFWIHLNVDYPFRLKGILYFPKLKRRLDSPESNIKLFCNRVFVSEQCKDILPDYLMMMRGAIDSPDIPLNVSRSYLQVDQNVKQLSAHISKKVSDKLNQLYKNERERFISLWPELETIIKLGLLQDDKFYERVKDLLIWETGEGQWTTATDLLDASEEKKIFYAPKNAAPASLLSLYKEQGKTVLFLSSPLDTAVIQFLEGKISATFQRIDGAMDPSLLDPSREKTVLDAEGKTFASRLADRIRQTLDQKDLTVEVKSLAKDPLPALLLFDEQERRLRDYLSLTQQISPKAVNKKTFVVNTNNSLIQALDRLYTEKPDIAKNLTQAVYDLSLLSHKEWEPSDLEAILARQLQALETLALSVTQKDASAEN